MLLIIVSEIVKNECDDALFGFNNKEMKMLSGECSYFNKLLFHCLLDFLQRT